ncbi:ABC transporter substrate-binding protein [Pseudarthrobacter siccitolerans]
MTRSSTSTRIAFGRRRLAAAAAVGVLVLTGVGALTGCTPGASSSDTSTSADSNGVLRVGVLGVGSTETLNPTHMDADVSIARAFQIFEPLVRMGTGDKIVENVLAESLIPNGDGSVWTLKLRSGVTWHDGTPLTADDVIYTMNYNVEKVTWAFNLWSNVDRANLKKVDDLTLEIPLTAPNFLYPESLVDINALIIKDGTTSFEHPVGTGPFKFKSFTPGQQSTFVRNDDYWDGAPKLASVEIDSINDETTRVNALMSGQVDAISGVPFSGIPQLEGAGLTVSNQPSGSWVGIRMNTKMKPFDDPRVREAMRLLIDREQVVSNAYGGNATIGNDLFGWFDPSFAKLPQLTYDPERARELLREAGYENLTLTLPTTNIGPGTSEMVTLFAASAAKAGVTINVKQTPAAEFYAIPQNDKQWSPTVWGGRPIASQINSRMSRKSIDAGLSETSWGDSDFLSAYEAAISTSDPAIQRTHLIEAQTKMYNDGPYIIPAFYNIVTASSESVTGFQTNMRSPFGDYDFTDVTVNK